MARQSIDFEHGGPVTGDSGERGDSTEGIDSIKPSVDGESAVASNFNRPGENFRQRTERLRDVGEDNLYLQDSDMSWALTAGRADGYADGESYPGVVNWNPGTGIFETTENLVVQPLNTPKEDVQETKAWTFTGAPDGVVSIKPLLDGVDAYKSKRAYNHANLIEVVWLEDTAANLAGAVVPGWCDVTVDGDLPHILTITIRDDALTQVTHVKTALDTVKVALLDPNGIGYSVTGTLSITIDYTADVSPKEYPFAGTFERELHYITPAEFASFFGSYSLDDGDTLAIWVEELVDDGTNDPPTGRRQAVPSNSNTTVGTGVGALFKTSLFPERIPLAIPLCKRIGDELFWLDGTVVMGVQSGTVLFGEHGNTVNRIYNWASTINLALYTDASPLSDDPVGISVAPLQTNLENIVDYVNTKGSLAADETVTGDWYFNANVAIGTSSPISRVQLGVENDSVDLSALSGTYVGFDNDHLITVGDGARDAQGISALIATDEAVIAVDTMTGAYIQAVDQGTGAIGIIKGLWVDSVASAASTVGQMWGADIGVTVNSAITITSAYGIDVRVDSGVAEMTGDLLGAKIEVVYGGTDPGGESAGLWVDTTAAASLTRSIRQDGVAPNWFKAGYNVFEGPVTVDDTTPPDMSIRIGDATPGVQTGGFATGRHEIANPAAGTHSVDNLSILIFSGTPGGTITDLTDGAEGQWLIVFNKGSSVTLDGSGFGGPSAVIAQNNGALLMYENSLWWVVALY